MGPQSDFAANPLTRAAAVRVCRRWKDLVYENQYFWRTVTLSRFMSREHITFTLYKALQAQDIRLVVDAQEYDSMTDGHFTIAVVCRPITDLNDLMLESVLEVFDAIAAGGLQLACVMAPFICLPSAALHRVEAYTRGLGQMTTMNLDAVNPMWFGAPVFSGLTELAMGRVWGLFRVDTTSLLVVLKSARQLTVLKLQDVDSIPQPRLRTAITLSRLTHFCFVYSRNHLRLFALRRRYKGGVAFKDFGPEGPRAISVMECELVQQRGVLVNVNLHSLNDDVGGPSVLHGPRCSSEYTVEVEDKRHRYTRKSTNKDYTVETNAEAVDCVWDSYPTRALPERWL
ncbi:hypothetical protein C8R47DRAFT_1190345 [Mycena vitilis]|nr:hypothetical protein C8R47DRAFT_1190345 [Mycena vitilis]